MSELLFEIGCEELPASYARGALDALPGILAKELSDRGLPVAAKDVRVAGTPRRLAASIASLPGETPRVKKTVTGPPKAAAYKDGKPTKAAEGFAAKNGIPVGKLSVISTDKGEYLAAEIEEGGAGTPAVLAEALPRVIEAIPFPKSMRWADLEQKFARPVRWIVAAYAGKAVPFTWGAQEAGTATHGHRFLSPGAVEVTSWSAYEAAMEKAGVLVDPEKRKAAVRKLAAAAAKEKGGEVEVDEALLETVSFLIENPTPVVGTFDPALLELPREVIVTPMKHHQRYFPVVDGKGALMPFFVTIANVPPKDPAVVARGNERVLRARLADAKYFYDLDRKTDLESLSDRLDKVVYQTKLGTYADKRERLRALALDIRAEIARGTGADGLPADAEVDRAARLAKADLLTKMVFEFPELQGLMGREYARRGGENPAIADAIAEHYLPKGAGDRLPASHLGAIVSLADRIDTLVGIFGIGERPTGSADPYGLRRHALAFLSIVRGKGYALGLESLFLRAARSYTGAGVKLEETAAREAIEFMRARLENALRDEGLPYDAVDAALSARFEDVNDAVARAKAVAELKKLPEIEPVAIGFKRAANILRQAPDADRGATVDPKLFAHDAERDLHETAQAVGEAVRGASKSGDWARALGETVKLKAPIDAFYDKVKVMDEDPKVRRNRLALLAGVVGIFSGIADFTKLVGA